MTRISLLIGIMTATCCMVLLTSGCGSKKSNNEAATITDNMGDVDRPTAAKEPVAATATELATAAVGASDPISISDYEFEVSENVPILKVQNEAKKLSTELLREVALKYREQIDERNRRISDLRQTLDGMSHEDRLSRKGAVIEREIDLIGRLVKALKSRFDIYLSVFKEKAGNLDGLDLNS